MADDGGRNICGCVVKCECDADLRILMFWVAFDFRRVLFCSTLKVVLFDVGTRSATWNFLSFHWAHPCIGTLVMTVLT